MSHAEIRMTGIGCFAGGVTLSRVLQRLMDAYSLGDWSSAPGAQPDASPAVQALKRLMHCGGRPLPPADGLLQDEDVAGFFLNFAGGKLHLSVFTRGRGRGCRKITAPLDDLARLRQSRLH